MGNRRFEEFSLLAGLCRSTLGEKGRQCFRCSQTADGCAPVYLTGKANILFETEGEKGFAVVRIGEESGQILSAFQP